MDSGFGQRAPPGGRTASPSSMMCGVIRTSRSRFSSRVSVWENSLPISGSSLRYGMPERLRVTCRLGEATDDRGLAVGDEELVVGAALVEEEPEVATDDVQPRLLGVDGHADLAVARDVRRDAENDAALLELHVGAGR